MSATLHHRGRWREVLLLVLSLAVLAVVASQPPLAQDPSYHDFADQRTLFGVPHFWNVVSNVPFGIIGILGCWWLIRRGRNSIAFEDPGERTAYFVFFIGGLLTCFGSAYYHATPTNATLLWDRLGLSLMLTSIFAIVVTEFVNQRFGRRMLVPMVAIGLISVLYWAYTESRGHGDLRPYAVVQFYPMLAMPIIFLLFRSRYTYAGAYWALLVLYGLAKVAELYDERIFEWTGFWSGHTFKHLIAAIASFVPLYWLQRRTLRRP